VHGPSRLETTAVTKAYLLEWTVQDMLEELVLLYNEHFARFAANQVSGCRNARLVLTVAGLCRLQQRSGHSTACSTLLPDSGRVCSARAKSAS